MESPLVRKEAAVSDPPRRSGPLAPGVSGGDGVGKLPADWGDWRCRYCNEYIIATDTYHECHTEFADYAWHADIDGTNAAFAANFEPLRAPVAPPATEWNDIAPHFDHDDAPHDDDFDIFVAEHEGYPCNYDPGTAPHTPDSARFPIGQRMGGERGALGSNRKMRRIGPRRSALWVFRHLSAVVARLQRGSVLTNCWGSDVGRAGVNRHGDRGSSTGRGEL